MVQWQPLRLRPWAATAESVYGSVCRSVDSMRPTSAGDAGGMRTPIGSLINERVRKPMEKAGISRRE